MSARKKRLIDPNTAVLLKHIGIGVLVITVVIIMLTTVWYGSRMPSLTIEDVQVQGGETISHEHVQSLVLRELEGDYIGLIPRRFAWFYPKDGIRESLVMVDRIHDIKVHRMNGKKILVIFDEYVPNALWCEPEQNSECLFLDINGYAFASAPELSGGSFLRLNKIGVTPELNTSITTMQDFSDIKLLSTLLSEKGWFVSRFEIDKDGDIYLILTEGGELKVSLTQSPEKTVGNLFTVLTSEEFLHIEPGNFQYIDLRFGNKVFVSEEELITETESYEVASSSVISQD